MTRSLTWSHALLSGLLLAGISCGDGAKHGLPAIEDDAGSGSGSGGSPGSGSGGSSSVGGSGGSNAGRGGSGGSTSGTGGSGGSTVGMGGAPGTGGVPGMGGMPGMAGRPGMMPGRDGGQLPPIFNRDGGLQIPDGLFGGRGDARFNIPDFAQPAQCPESPQGQACTGANSICFGRTDAGRGGFVFCQCRGGDGGMTWRCGG